MFNEKIVGTITQFSGTFTPDKNGNYPVMVQCIAGRMPNRNVLAGTLAERAGFIIGRTYIIQVRQAGFDKEYGPDYTFTKVAELTSGADIIRTCEELGDPEIINVERPEGYEENHQRKGVAVEGQRTERIKKGLYEPAYPKTSTDHNTAREVIKGSSTNPNEPENKQNLGNETNQQGGGKV